MSVKYDSEKFSKRTAEITEKYDLHTKEDLDRIASEGPEKMEQVLTEAGNAFIDSLIGKSFADLTQEDMMNIQGAGDVEAETVGAFIASAAIGGLITILK